MHSKLLFKPLTQEAVATLAPLAAAKIVLALTWRDRARPRLLIRNAGAMRSDDFNNPFFRTRDDQTPLRYLLRSNDGLYQIM